MGTNSTLVAALLFAAATSGCGASAPPPDATAGAEARCAAALAAASETIEGAVRVGEMAKAQPRNHNLPRHHLHRTDGIVTAEAADVVRFDWTKPLEAASGGPAQLVVAQSQLHQAVLAKAGFAPVNLGYSVHAPLDAPLLGEVRMDFAGGPFGGSHGDGWIAPATADRIVHQLLYQAPGTGAFVLVRIDLDGATRIATVETQYVETTVLGAAYPATPATASERFVSRK